MSGAPVLDDVRVIHTLGPTGTNLEMAAYHWFARRGQEADVRLHTTLESALPELADDGREAVLACAVYPDLHSLVFNNLGRLAMVDSFILPTYDMVFAAQADAIEIRTVVSHPAPQSLVRRAAPQAVLTLVTSNSAAARQCATGIADGCITTSKAAADHGLSVLRNFGPVPMIYTLHQAGDFLAADGPPGAGPEAVR
jgi:prephenate dehydratase